MDDLERELKLTFIEEAKQLLLDAEQGFLELEKNPHEGALIDQIFRLAHNLKGSSRAVGLDELGSFTHELESLLLKIKKGEIHIHPNVVSLLLQCNDHLRIWVDELSRNLNFEPDSTLLVQNLKNCADNSLDTHKNSPEFGEFAKLLAEETERQIELATTLDEEETIPPPPVEIPPPTPPPPPPKGSSITDESIRISLGRLEKLLNYVGELVIFQSVLHQQTAQIDHHELKKTLQQMGKVTKEIQEISMGLRMVPLKQTFQKMQRIVRDTSTTLKKQVELLIEGEDTEVDKTVLEALSDPLVHLIRNAVDHGIEAEEQRLEAGKNKIGSILLKAYHQGGKLRIEISDDGRGISAEKIKQQALAKGLIRPQQTFTDKECIELIFLPGFSTKDEITEVSGRGVGMDVVKTNIQNLKGDINIETQLGKGSLFRISLPLTLAIIDGMVVTSSHERFVIPLSHVYESIKPQPKDIQWTTNLGEILLLRGENIPIIRLSEALGKKESKEKIAIIIHSQKNKFATFVDDILGQHQVVVKKLGSELQHLKGYSGTAILGDGKPALILEISDLVQSGLYKRRLAS